MTVIIIPFNYTTYRKKINNKVVNPTIKIIQIEKEPFRKNGERKKIKFSEKKLDIWKKLC